MSTSLLTPDDLYLFNEGTHTHLHEKLGAHISTSPGEPGTSFAVWAPDAASVTVTGDFNGWEPLANPLSARERSGIWEGFVPGIGRGTVYKYHVRSACGFATHNGAVALTTLFVTHYNFLRPHGALGYQIPVPLPELSSVTTLQGRWNKILELALAA